MDIFSHALLALTLGSLARMNKGLLAAFVLGAIAPDLDPILIPLNYIHPTTLLLVHRGITHTLFFGAITAVIVLFLASRHSVRAAMSRLADVDIIFSMPELSMAYAGVLSHLFLDYLTTRGVPLFYPWAATRFSADLFFHTEIIMIVVSLVVMAGLFRDRGQDRSRAKLFVAFISIFLVLGEIRMDGKEMSDGLLADSTAKSYPQAHIFKWSILAEDEDRYEVYEYDALAGISRLKAAYPRIQATSSSGLQKALQAAEELPAVKLFRWRAYAVAINATLENYTWNLEYYDPVVRAEINRLWPLSRMTPKGYSSLEVEVNRQEASVV